MRILYFDHSEFERPEAEENLELWIAAKSKFFPEVQSFTRFAVSSEAAIALGSAQQFDAAIAKTPMLRGYLERFGRISVPTPCDWPTHVLNQEWDDLDCIIDGGEFFVRFHWWTTA